MPTMWVVIVLVFVATCLLAIYAGADALCGRADFTVLAWILIFPLGYYFLTFPRERSIFTLDRAMIGILIVALIFGSRSPKVFLTREAKRAGIAWILFIAAILVSLLRADNPLGKIKELMDVFVFPGILAWYVIRNFSLRQHLSKLHALTCLMSIYVAGIGLAELKTGQDLLPLSAAVFLVEGTGLARVNGPFATNNSFGLIGLLSFLLLLFLRRAIGSHMPAGQRILHLVGIACALAIAVMPMFRSILLTLLLIVSFEFYGRKRAALRIVIVGSVLLAVLGLLWFKKTAPDMFEYRVSDPSDVYARVAQQRQTWEMFLAHPIVGVGWGNYISEAYKFSDVSFGGVLSVGSSHNTLGTILVETGLLGFLSFLTAQVLLFRTFQLLRREGTPDRRLAATFFNYVFLAYWITGVSLSSGYYADLNLWFLFVIAILYKFAVTEPSSGRLVHRGGRVAIFSSMRARQSVSV